MLAISDNDFEQMISTALDSLPEKYVAGLQNVAIVYEDEPTPEQRKKLKLRNNESLYGLFEGTPRTSRMGYVSLPDKITVFKLPMMHSSSSIIELQEQVRHTLWHEIAHYFGLNHADIAKLESTQPGNESTRAATRRSPNI